MKLKDMIGVVFRKDEIVNIWEEIIRNYNRELVWNGEASEIPEKYLDKECIIFPFYYIIVYVYSTFICLFKAL